MRETDSRAQPFSATTTHHAFFSRHIRFLKTAVLLLLLWGLALLAG
jgi:hypothetical protein